MIFLESILQKTSYHALKPLFILETLAQSSSYMGINEICEYTGFSQSTVHRILNEMVQCGYVEKNERYKKYKVGMEAIILAGSFFTSSSVVTLAREELQRLNQLTLETVHLLAVSGDDVVYIDKVDTKHSLGLMSAIGKHNPIYCTSGGKAILAFQLPDQIERYIRTVERRRFTEQTIVEEDAFRAELEQIRAQGYAVDNGEHHSDVTCVGAPIFGHGGNAIASISIAAPTARFSLEKAHELAPQVVESAHSVSLKLGGV